MKKITLIFSGVLKVYAQIIEAYQSNNLLKQKVFFIVFLSLFTLSSRNFFGAHYWELIVGFIGFGVIMMFDWVKHKKDCSEVSLIQGRIPVYKRINY